MTAKEKLIKVQEIKAEAIKIDCRLDCYFNEEDKKDLESWSNKQCEEVLKSIRESINKGCVYVIDYCPWCIINFSNCDTCSYGKNHGICNVDEDNDYDKICDELSEEIMELYIGRDSVFNLIKNIVLEEENC